MRQKCVPIRIRDLTKVLNLWQNGEVQRQEWEPQKRSHWQEIFGFKLCLIILEVI